MAIRRVLLLALLMLGSTTYVAAVPAAPPDDWVAQGRALADQLVGELKTELSAAMQSAGPVAAIAMPPTRRPAGN